MRRLTGISFLSDGPVRASYMELADLTVLTGANDSGKSRVLQVICEALGGELLYDQAYVFALADRDELVALLEDPDDLNRHRDCESLESISELVSLPEDERWVPVSFQSMPYTEDEIEAFRWGRAPQDLEEPLDFSEREPHLRFVQVPEEPLTIGSLGRLPAALVPVSVSLPAVPAQVSEEVGKAVTHLARALRKISMDWDDFADAVGPLRDGPEGGWESIAIGIEDDTHRWNPSPQWLLETDERSVAIHPAAELACGLFERSVARLLPEFITADYRVRVTPESAIRIAAGARVTIELERPDAFPVADQIDAGPADESDAAPADAADAADDPILAADDPSLDAFDDIDLDLAEAVELGAADDPDLDPADDADLEEEDPTALRFALTDAPSGFELWLHLGLLELSARIANLCDLVPVLLAELNEIWIDGLGRQEDDSYGQHPGVQAIKRLLEDMLDGLHAPRGNPVEELIDPLYEGIQALEPSPATDTPAHLDLIASRVYIIDEPEQRLHPALARRAARWLASAMDTWHAQAILATHSLAFIDLPGNVNVYELTRERHEAHLHRIDVADLTPHTQLIRELGLDRGQLLDRVQAFLFTDTDQLATLLQASFASRLRASGIEVHSLDATRSAGGLAQLALLLELTAIPIAAVFTTLDGDDVQRIRHQSAAARITLAKTDGPAGTLARLIDLELRHERTIHLHTLALGDDAAPPDPQDIALEDRADPTRVASRESGPGHPPLGALDDLLWRIEQLSLEVI